MNNLRVGDQFYCVCMKTACSVVAVNHTDCVVISKELGAFNHSLQPCSLVVLRADRMNYRAELELLIEDLLALVERNELAGHALNDLAEVRARALKSRQAITAADREPSTPPDAHETNPI